MPTKSIQASGGDYTSVAAWEAYLEGVATLSADEIGQINNEELSTTGGVTFANITPGVFRVILEAQSGDSFRDNANKLTNALRYSAVGARWTDNSSTSMLIINISNMTIRNLMLKKVSNYGRAIHYIDGVNTNQEIENIVLESAGIGGDAISAANVTIRNSVIIDNGDDSNNACVNTGLDDTQIVNCVIARTTTTGTNRKGVSDPYSLLTIVNTAVLGFPTDATGTPAGTNNATDQSFSGMPATNLQTSLVGATEFESVTNGSEDFRLKSTSVKCKDNGTASGSPTPPSADIVGQARSGNTDIGVWEFQSGGGGSPAPRQRLVGGGYWY